VIFSFTLTNQPADEPVNFLISFLFFFFFFFFLLFIIYENNTKLDFLFIEFRL